MSVNCFDIWVKGAGKTCGMSKRGRFKGTNKSQIASSQLCLVKCVLQILPIHALPWTARVCGKK